MSAADYQFRLDLQKRMPAQADGSAGSVGWTDKTKISTLASGLACDIQMASGAIRQRYSQAGLFVTHSIYFPRDCSARVNMRFAAPDGSAFYLIHGYGPMGGSNAPGSWCQTWVATCEQQLAPG